MKRLTALILTLLLLLTACSAPPQTAVPGEDGIGNLSVHFIDVGQADCILLRTDEGAILIDGGNTDTSTYVLSYLNQYGVDEIDLMINTHPHGDHLGGLPPVLSLIPTETVWTSTDHYDTSLFDRFLWNADKQDSDIVVPEIGSVYTLGALKLTVLGPRGKNYEDLNDTSIVVMAEFGEHRFLFTGDMETFAENELLDADVDLKADILKVGHHGSYSSTSYQFLRKVDPDFGVISCGRENEYGHPHDAPMSRLDDAEVTLFRTDLMGNVVATSNGEDLAFFWDFADAMPKEYPDAA